MSRWSRKLRKIFQVQEFAEKTDILLTRMTLREVYDSERTNDPKHLLAHGYKVYSQTDEDGIIHEIFNRIGVTNRTFVEFGVAGGLENNSLNLLINGWSGLWIEAHDGQAAIITERFAAPIAEGLLKLEHDRVTAENIDRLISGAGINGEIDILSIDIDGNDYHVAKAITCVNPRLVVMEYNAKFRPPTSWVMAYNPDHVWDETDYFGASLQALEKLFTGKGYSLVGCNISGANAFFVRNDLVGDYFHTPFTAENHYEPARYWIVDGFISGHPPRFGPYETP
ncbi:MAG: hypothetical protein QGH32_04885 [Alphaproteobacteria bacterium]|nr:hypothetical protein [Alphaproteobacteria bacterium]